MTDKQKEYQASYAFPCHLMDDTMFDINSAHASIRSINIPPNPHQRALLKKVYGEKFIFFSRLRIRVLRSVVSLKFVSRQKTYRQNMSAAKLSI